MGNCILLITSRERERKGKERGEEGRGTAVREEIWGAGTQSFGTWHWLREGAAALPGSAFNIGGEKREERSGRGRQRVPAEVDGRGLGFMPRWEPRAGAMALSDSEQLRSR